MMNRLALVVATVLSQSAISSAACCSQIRISAGATFPHPDATGLFQVMATTNDGKPVYENSAGYKLFYQIATEGASPIQLNSWRVATTVAPTDFQEAVIISENDASNDCPQKPSEWQTKFNGQYQLPSAFVVISACESKAVCCTSIFIPAVSNGGYFFQQPAINSPAGIHAKATFRSQDGKLLAVYKNQTSVNGFRWAVTSVASGAQIYFADGSDSQCPDGADGWPVDFDVLCGTPGPTTSPSISPTTSAPTISPSLSPSTSTPSLSPTTSSPTISPSISPTTSSPTISPSLSPTTSSPTISPSISPTTTSPTVSPSLSPTTSSPTISPSISPTTSSPSISPSISPTTSSPTISPSISPTTSSPTISPSLSPTSSSPTISPSTSPTTSSPTMSPSLSPTTSSPSVSPSISPTTSSPSISPSLSPTTSSPSVSPSISPTTSSPSISPTHSPTLSPTVTTEPTTSPSTSPTLSPTRGDCAYFCGSTFVPSSDGSVCGIRDKLTYPTACEACQQGNAGYFTSGKCTTLPPTITPTASPTSTPTSSPTPTFCSQADYAACYQGDDCDPIPECDTGLAQILNDNYPSKCADLAISLTSHQFGIISTIPFSELCACLPYVTDENHINALKCIPSHQGSACTHQSLFEDRAACNVVAHVVEPSWKSRSMCISDVVLEFDMSTFGGCAVAAATAFEIHPHIILLSNDVNNAASKYFSYSAPTGECKIHSPTMMACSSFGVASVGQGFFELVDGESVQIWENGPSGAQKTTLANRTASIRCNHNELTATFFIDDSTNLKLCTEMTANEVCMDRDSTSQECTRVLELSSLNAKPGGDGRMYLPQDIVSGTNLTESAEIIMTRKPVNVFEPELECRGGSDYCEHTQVVTPQRRRST